MKKINALLICFLFAFNANAQLNMSLLGQLPYGQNLSDVWGYADGNGNEYAIVGVFNAVSIVDVTDPYNPVEVFNVSGPNSTWRDMKTWNGHAYITNENTGGLMIIDMTTLPGNPNLAVNYYNGSTYPFESVHNLYIDENGVVYLFGADNGVGGAIMLDVSVDPKNPTELGRWNDFYVHDGVVRGDTLWAACLNDGVIAVDVGIKTSPSIMTSWTTPNNFAHNCWFSDDNNYMFTTDEKSDAYIAAYDVSDFSNVFETDKIQSTLSPSPSGVIPHNTHYINGFLVTSYYTDGVHVTDANRPNNLIKTGGYDTSPNFSGNGFSGAWGAYPFLPSGVVLVSDVNEGLYVLGPTYTQACYLEGAVTDSITGIPINGATVKLIGQSIEENTNITGDYATGIVTAGTYTIQVGKLGYHTKTFTGVTLNTGIVTQLDVELVSAVAMTLNGSVQDAGGSAISNAQVTLIDPFTGQTSSFLSDLSGNFTSANFLTGTYDLLAGQWGYITNCSSINVTVGTPVVITLNTGYYDDFTFDFSWNVVTNAASGAWERGEPVGTTISGTQSNPEYDVNGDCLDQCYVTGNGGGSAANDDVDNGFTILTSPIFDATIYNDPYVSFYTWFFNSGGFTTPDDSLVIRLSDGNSTVELVRFGPNSPGNSSWVYNNFRISDFITPNATMTLIAEAADMPGGGNLCEAGLDVFSVTEGSVGISDEPSELILSAYPNPFENNIQFVFDKEKLAVGSVLVMTDITGKVVYKLDITNTDNVKVGSELTRGVYLSYIISDSGKSAVIKVIKQ